MAVNVVHALLMMGSWQTIKGLGVWLEQVIGVSPLWILAAEEQAKSRSDKGGRGWEWGRQKEGRGGEIER